MIKPFLKWAGGKRQLIPEIIKYVPAEYDTYFEPFIGAGALFFSLKPKKAHINDSNGQLINTYISVRDNIDVLIPLLKEHKQANCEEYFYKIRALDREPDTFARLTGAEKAARLIYLNKTCFNGLYRVNSQGHFNAPYGRYSNPTICDEAVLKAVSEYLRGNDITITSGDFSEALDKAGKKSFVYIDSPYHSQKYTGFTDYQVGGFNEQEQVRLRQTFSELTGRGVKCLLSNSATPFILDLYKGFDIHILKAGRAINSNVSGRGKVNEVLVKNW